MAPDVPAEDAGAGLLTDDVNRAERIAHHHDGQHRKRQGDFVADRLSRSPKATEQRVLVVGGVTTHQQADRLDAAERDPQKNADADIADQQVLTKGNDQPGDDHRDHHQHRAEGEQEAVGSSRNDVLLHQQLEAVGEGLQHTKGTGVFGTDPLLHSR